SSIIPKPSWVNAMDLDDPAHRRRFRQVITRGRQRRIVVYPTGEGGRQGNDGTTCARPDAIGDDLNTVGVVVDLVYISILDHPPDQALGHADGKVLCAANETLIGAKGVEVPDKILG